MKRQLSAKNVNLIINGAIIVIAVLIIWLLISQRISGPDSDLPLTTLPVNEDGLIEVVIPQNLFGGKDKTAEETIKEYHKNPDRNTIMTDVVPNEDGSITLFLTEEQLRTSKQNIDKYSQFQNGGLTQSVREIIYENELMTEITVLVDSSMYRDNLFDRMLCESLLAGSAGTYQVLSGIPPDEWHTTITVKDAKTREIISQNDFPNENMYTVY